MTVKSPGRKRWPTSVRHTQVADAVSATRTSKPVRQTSGSGAEKPACRPLTLQGRRAGGMPRVARAWCGRLPLAGEAPQGEEEPTVGAKGSSSRRFRWVTLHTLTDRRSSGYPGQPPMSAGNPPKSTPTARAPQERARPTLAGTLCRSPAAIARPNIRPLTPQQRAQANPGLGFTAGRCRVRQVLSIDTGIQVYFCAPTSPWRLSMAARPEREPQRGCSVNTEVRGWRTAGGPGSPPAGPVERCRRSSRSRTPRRPW